MHACTQRGIAKQLRLSAVIGTSACFAADLCIKTHRNRPREVALCAEQPEVVVPQIMQQLGWPPSGGTA